jgi:hypothetical protein
MGGMDTLKFTVPDPAGVVFATFESSSVPGVVDGFNLTGEGIERVLGFDPSGTITFAKVRALTQVRPELVVKQLIPMLKFQGYGCSSDPSLDRTLQIAAQPDGSTFATIGTYTCEDFTIEGQTLPGPLAAGMPSSTCNPAWVSKWASNRYATLGNFSHTNQRHRCVCRGPSCNVFTAGNAPNGLDWPGTSVGNLSHYDDNSVPFVA